MARRCLYAIARPADCLAGSGVAKPARAALGFFEFVDQFEMSLYHGNKHKLGNALTYRNSESSLPTVPAGHHQLTLIIRIDQADQITQDNAMFMAQPRTRQDQCGEPWISDINGQAGRNQNSLAGFERDVFLEHGTQVKTSRAGRSVGWQRKIGTKARIENFGLKAMHELCA